MPDIEKVIKGMEQFIADLKPFCGNKSDWQRVDDALALLKSQEQNCRECGEATSKAIQELQTKLKAQEPIEARLHLCDSCTKLYPECDATADGIEFGCGVGNDNIIGCTAYENRWKAQEPRVMTKDELDGYILSFDGEARVWIEHRKHGLYCASLWSSNPSRGDDNFYDAMYECYYDRLEIGHWWRPWTSRPDEKRRAETPWN